MKVENEKFIPVDQRGEAIPTGIITPGVIEVVALKGKAQAPVPIQTVENPKEWGESLRRAQELAKSNNQKKTNS